jgi:hypothetical protein
MMSIKEERLRANNDKQDNIFNFFLEYERSGRSVIRD